MIKIDLLYYTAFFQKKHQSLLSSDRSSNDLLIFKSQVLILQEIQLPSLRKLK